MILAERLWKRFDATVAVRDLSLHVPAGVTLGLVGPNGSGKTTLLRMFSTLAKPDRGRVRIAGVDAVAEPREVRRRMAFMPAEFGCPDSLSIGEYLEFFSAAAGLGRAERRTRIAAALELTDLLGREDENLGALSTGNRQRALLAKTLLTDPPLLLLDEPSSGLDPRARAEVRALLAELAAMGKTIVVSSHILADLEEICSHVCILERGRLVEHGALAELKTKHRARGRVLRFRLGGGDGAGAVRSLPGVARVEAEGESLLVALDDGDPAAVLRALLDAGVTIREFREEAADLESIFLAATEGGVS